MTSVDFYLAALDAADFRQRTACRLADKAYRLGHSVYLAVPDEAAARTMDALLWTFSDESFVPHALVDTDGNCADTMTPVQIGYTMPPESLHDVLINLTEDIPGYFSRFERVAEIVGASAEQKHAGRERFRFYRDRGYALSTHELQAGRS